MLCADVTKRMYYFPNAHVELTEPHGEVADAACLRTVLPKAQKDTSRATATCRLQSITALHDESSPPGCGVMCVFGVLVTCMYSGLVGVNCLWLVQRCWPAFVGWRFLCMCAFNVP